MNGYLVVLSAMLLAGCATTFEPPGREALSRSERAAMGRLAIRGPMPPSVALVGDEVLETKNEAAKSKAAGAAMGWFGGSLQAGAESGDPLGFMLMAMIGIVGAPVAAVGGAVYGASAADSAEALESGNATIAEALGFAPQHFRGSLEKAMSAVVGLDYGFVDASASDEDLLGAGFDAVLNVHMESISSNVSDNGLEVRFSSSNTMELISLSDRRMLVRRHVETTTPARNVSDWAAESASPLFADLDAGFDDMAAEVVDVFFLAPSIRVRGLEPVSRSSFRVGRINTLRPLFVWGVVDGERPLEQHAGVEYEVLVFPRGKSVEAGDRVAGARYVPGASLAACTTYEWKVRAHYTQFEDAATSDWTPEYRFKTPCEG